MKYLVLHSFTSYGRLLRKGEVVDEAEIRSPRLRISESKIIPAVSSSPEPVDAGVAAPVPQVQGPNEGDQDKSEAPKKPLFSVNHK